MAKLDLSRPITVNDTTYEPDELYQRKLTVYGVQPTNYEQYVFLDILSQHKNTKVTQDGDQAGGYAQATYRYNDLHDLHKFNAHQYPYTIDVVMTDIADKKGNTIPVIIHVDFDNVQELQLVPRNQKPTNAALATPAVKA